MSDSFLRQFLGLMRNEMHEYINMSPTLRAGSIADYDPTTFTASVSFADPTIDSTGNVALITSTTHFLPICIAGLGTNWGIFTGLAPGTPVLVAFIDHDIHNAVIVANINSPNFPQSAAVQSGESYLFSPFGSVFSLKTDGSLNCLTTNGNINLESSGGLLMLSTVDGDVTIETTNGTMTLNAPTITGTATTSISLSAPSVSISSNGGASMSASGAILQAGATGSTFLALLNSLAAAVYNSHTHPTPSGISGPPNQTMSSSDMTTNLQGS